MNLDIIGANHQLLVVSRQSALTFCRENARPTITGSSVESKEREEQGNSIPFIK
jgi:hypothetical protein